VKLGSRKEHVEDVVARGPCEGVREGEERRAAAIVRHALDRLSSGCVGEAGQGRHAARRQPGEIHVVDPEFANLVHAIEGAGEPGRVAARRRTAQPVEVRLPLPLIGDEQPLELRVLLGQEGLAQPLPEAGRRPIADAGDGSREHRGTGEQDLALEEPGRGEVEEHRRALARDPRPGVEPPQQPERRGRLAEVAVAEVLADPGAVIPPRLGRAVARQAFRIDAEERGHVPHHAGGHVGRVWEERPQEPHGPELHREAEAVPVTSGVPSDEVASLGVELEVLVELLQRRLAGEPPVPPFLFLGQKSTGTLASEYSESRELHEQCTRLLVTGGRREEKV
jgi:hypothetical protein